MSKDPEMIILGAIMLIDTINIDPTSERFLAWLSYKFPKGEGTMIIKGNKTIMAYEDKLILKPTAWASHKMGHKFWKVVRL